MPSILIGCSANLQVARTGTKSCTSAKGPDLIINSWVTFNELPLSERHKIFVKVTQMDNSRYPRQCYIMLKLLDEEGHVGYKS